jgi:hypothetical protein
METSKELAKGKPADAELVLVVPDTLKGYSLGEEAKADVMSIADRSAFFIQVKGAMETKKLKDTFNGGLIDKSFLPVVNLETGEEAFIILPRVLESIFTKLGPSAIGKSYGVQSLGKNGKAYNQFRVFELKKK